MAKLDPTPYPLTTTFKTTRDWRAIARYEEQVWSKLDAQARALKPGEVVGALVDFPVGDGRAVYVVTKASPLTLQHVPLGGGYAIPAAHVRGLTKADVLVHVRARQASPAPIRLG